MRRIFLAALVMMFVCGVAVAQDFPKAEVFGGYSLLRLGISGSLLDDVVSSIEAEAPAGTTISASTSKFMMKGFNASVAFNGTPVFGALVDFRYNQDDVVEFSANAEGSSISGKVKLRDIAIMAGPRFTLRKNERVTPFAHALVGLDYWRLSGEATVDGESVDPGTAETNRGLGVAVGGGLDVNMGENVALRLIQADYFLTRHEEEIWNNLNLAFGVVFKFGK